MREVAPEHLRRQPRDARPKSDHFRAAGFPPINYQKAVRSLSNTGVLIVKFSLDEETLEMDRKM